MAEQSGWLDTGIEGPGDEAIAAALGQGRRVAISTVPSVQPYREVVIEYRLEAERSVMRTGVGTFQTADGLLMLKILEPEAFRLQLSAAVVRSCEERGFRPQ